MIEIESKNLYIYKQKRDPHILFSFKVGDSKSNWIKLMCLSLETDFSRQINVRTLKINWLDLKSTFNLPKNITCSTVFYFRNGFTIGSIENPNNEELKAFFIKCTYASLNMMPSDLAYNFENECLLLQQKIQQLNMQKIVSFILK